MAKKETRVYSRYTNEAVQLLANLIKEARLMRKITTIELAERAGISRSLLNRIENGDLACGIGVVFEVASILEIPLFQADYSELAVKNKALQDKLTLLPNRIRKSKVEVDDDF